MDHKTRGGAIRAQAERKEVDIRVTQRRLTTRKRRILRLQREMGGHRMGVIVLKILIDKRKGQ